MIILDTNVLSALMQQQPDPQVASDAGPLAAIAEAVASGSGLPALARAVARALDAGLVVTDRGGAVLAVAARSRDEERRLLAAQLGNR